MSIQAWADAARQAKHYEGVEHQRAINELESLLVANTAPEKAATTISSIYTPLLKDRSKPSPIGTLWAILCDAVRALGGDEELADRLVQLVNGISKLPDVKDDQGNAITPKWAGAGVYWRDLPELSMIFREYAIEAEPEEELDDDIRVRQTQSLLNTTTFGALYLAHGQQRIGMSFHAEVSLMQGVEVPYQTPDQQRHAAMYVAPAATWILLAAEKIHELCKTNHDRKAGAPGATPNKDEWLWGKGRGYSVERWALWKKRFGEIAGTEGLEDNVREIAGRAASRMGGLEMFRWVTGMNATWARFKSRATGWGASG